MEEKNFISHIPENGLAMNEEEKQKIQAILDEIDEYAEEIRNDWNFFDGRVNRRVLNDFTSRIQNVLYSEESEHQET